MKRCWTKSHLSEQKGVCTNCGAEFTLARVQVGRPKVYCGKWECRQEIRARNRKKVI